jgi:ABC-type branched-subunit amino acid transport system ATPase component
MNQIVKVQNLTKVYDGFFAVDHVNFSVNKGGIFGFLFLGPKGAGKTTTWIAVDFAVLFIFRGLFFYLTVKLHKKTLPKRI